MINIEWLTLLFYFAINYSKTINSQKKKVLKRQSVAFSTKFLMFLSGLKPFLGFVLVWLIWTRVFYHRVKVFSKYFQIFRNIIDLFNKSCPMNCSFLIPDFLGNSNIVLFVEKFAKKLEKFIIEFLLLIIDNHYHAWHFNLNKKFEAFFSKLKIIFEIEVSSLSAASKCCTIEADNW